MKHLAISLILLFNFSSILNAQTLTVQGQSADRVGVRNTAPEYTLHVKHGTGSPIANNNGLCISHDLGAKWTMYVQNSQNSLQFYKGQIAEVEFTSDGSINTLSDERSKKNIALVPDGQLEKLLELSPKTYQYKDSPTGKVCTGFLAQELFEVFPTVVNHNSKNDDGNESWMVSYMSLVPYLVKGIQEQNAIIGAQQKELDLLKQQQQEILNRIAKLEK